jgi:hypothetical protein
MAGTASKTGQLGKYLKWGILALLVVIVITSFSSVGQKLWRDGDDLEKRGAISLAGKEIKYLEQGWDGADSLWFYYTTQG